MTTIRTRFAPSPTGMLHIGGFRSALFAWLFARHHGGKFVLRIEDTDAERKVPGSVQYILECFDWFGLDIDEGPTQAELREVDEALFDGPDIGGPYGPYVQSLRRARYVEIAEQLIVSGHAFRCDCTPEMLDQEREEQRSRGEVPGYGGRCRDQKVPETAEHVVRFRMPEKPDVVLQDGIRGEIAWDSVPLRDPVILKSDGLPTYHLAVVVDDHDMEISHAMRGEEWIPSTPLHLLIYQALGWTPPVFCHLPVVLGPDGKKLSKRHGSTAWSSFRDEGYFPEAVLNFVARIGWSPGEGSDDEIFTREQMAEKFTLEDVNPASGIFEYEKLNWMNGIYLRSLSGEHFSTYAKPFLGDRLTDQQWELLAPHIQERTKVLSDLPGLVGFVTSSRLEREMEYMITKKVNPELAKKILLASKDALHGLSDFSVQSLEAVLKSLAEQLELKVGAIFMTLRIAVLGKKATPPLFESIVAVGRELTVRRIEEAVELVTVME